MLQWFGDEVDARLRAAGGQALYLTSAALLTRANKTCPHDTGMLEGSGENDVDRSKLEATISYGGPAAPYAVAVHEAPPSINFRGDGRRKWLEKTAREMSEELEEEMAKVIQEHMK